ncbi:MAG: response regulator [Terriglobales bacterium]
MPLRILLADDSTTAQKMAVKFLEGAGHEVIAVSNGAQALKKIKAEKLDLAVLDINMPGYNGLEVCEKIRVIAETANLAVILTVGKMEHHNPGDAERVKAEGVIIKPFEEKDLLAAVKKIEDKLAAAAASAYQATQKLAPVEEIKDATYEEWKVSAPETEEPLPPKAFSVPDDMASAPAFGMDMLGEASATPTQEITAPDAGRITRALEMSRNAVPHRDPEVEFTSPPREASSGFGAAQGLEPTIAEASSSAGSGLDPALVTDRSEMVSAFPTTFGNFGDEISVGVAADMPGVYEDTGAPATEAPASAEDAAEPAAAAPAPAEEDDFEARVRAAMSSYETTAPAEAAPPEAVVQADATASYDFKTTPAVEPIPPGWTAEEETLVAGEASLSLEQEMQRAYTAVAVEEEPPPPPPPVEAASAPPAPAAVTPPEENKPDAELAAAMSAAMGSEVAPAAAAPYATTMVDANTIALIVNRVTERMKPQLIEEIARELAAEMERMKK